MMILLKLSYTFFSSHLPEVYLFVYFYQFFILFSSFFFTPPTWGGGVGFFCIVDIGFCAEYALLLSILSLNLHVQSYLCIFLDTV